MLSPIVYLHRFNHRVQRHYFAFSHWPAHLLCTPNWIYHVEEDSWTTNRLRTFQTRQMGYHDKLTLVDLFVLRYHLDAIPYPASGNSKEYELRRTNSTGCHY